MPDFFQYRLLAFAALLSCVGAASPALPGPGESKGKGKSSPEFRKEIKAAARLLKANRIDQAVEKLQAVLERFPEDPQAPKAKKILRQYGVSDEIRVRLNDRIVFRGRLKITEKSVLEKGEKTLDQLRGYYKGLKPFFTKHKVTLVFYDGQKRFRESGGSVTTAGHFRITKEDIAGKSMEGEISWHLPAHARTPKDRTTSIDSLLFHELTHYLNAIHFAKALPSVLDEGLATFMTSRLNTTYYQYYRVTDRQNLETNARNSLNLIAKYKDFLEFLGSKRGFGKGDSSINRWYSLCHAVVDTLIEGKKKNKNATAGRLLRAIEAKIHKAAPKAKGGKAPEPVRQNARNLLEELAVELYDLDLDRFHKTLVKRVLGNYKQR